MIKQVTGEAVSADRLTNAATLLSTTGAAIAGVGAGVLLSPVLRTASWALLGLGVVVHVFGMVGKWRAERRRTYLPTWWERAAYWSCWAAIAALAVFLAIRAL